MENRLIEVLSAELHSAARFGGSKTEATLNQTKLQGAKFLLQPMEGLYVLYKGEKIFIPSANLKAVWMRNEAEDQPKQLKKSQAV